MTEQDAPRPLSAAVLAGGMSRRMGRDKALLPLVDDGPAMLEIVLQRLSEVANDLLVVANDRERYAPFGARVVPDAFPGIGALGGIHSALAHARHEYCLVVACDMPFLNPDILRMMANERRDFDILVPEIPGESRQSSRGLVFQTLHAIYGKGCIPPIEAQIAAGNRQIIGFFDQVRVRAIGIGEITRFDPELRSFYNANTPEALAAATRIDRGGNIGSGCNV
ncbi:MAG: molybdenum cofactor guanylyltransferase [Thermomicrobiales bacterium]|nr:molybdenum cofactor guanylyltransferase [Thermomicrobiales bacterium]